MPAPWRKSSANGVWSTLGPYFAMMPVPFVRDAVERFCPPGGAVLDPFMGRGTALYAARVTGRTALGADLSPLAWLYSAAKCDPEPDPMRLIDRLGDLEADTRPEDRDPENEFQAWAWCPAVLAFLRSARRNLDWRDDRTDRTLMSIILVYLHGKLGSSLGNQMIGARASAPDYSVDWWRKFDMRPPSIDPIDYVAGRIEFRYHYGIPTGLAADVRLGPSQEVLPDPDRDPRRFDLMLTSPPYMGVTNYRRDNWIRLWMLGDLPLPHTSDTTQKYCNKPAYVAMLRDVLHRSAQLLKPDGTVYVRTDSRPWTRDVTAAIIADTWPGRRILWRAERPKKTQTGLLNAKSGAKSPGETDFLITSPDADVPDGFTGVPDDVIVAGEGYTRRVMPA